MKTMALVCAAMLTFSASAFGMHLAGWFHKASNRTETRQVQANDSKEREAIAHYQHNMGTRLHLLPIYQ
jgi:hypothetical protein